MGRTILYAIYICKQYDFLSVKEENKNYGFLKKVQGLTEREYVFSCNYLGVLSLIEKDVAAKLSNFRETHGNKQH